MSDLSKVHTSNEQASSLTARFFNKPLATVHVRPNITITERKLWNLLTRNAAARPSLRKFQVPLTVLKRAANLTSRSNAEIETALKTLQSSPILFIRQDDEGDVQEDMDWIQFSYLASVGVRDGAVIYTYPQEIYDDLTKPEIYARINLISQKGLKKDRSVHLFENVARFRPNKGFPGLTEIWSLPYLRALLDAESACYDDFKVFNRSILKPAVAKINKQTDLLVDPIFHKTGRKVTAIQFSVTDNPERKLFVDKEISDSQTYQDLIEAGIAPLQAEQFIEDHDDPYLRRHLESLHAQIEKIEDPGAWIVSAITNRWSPDSGKDLKKKITGKKRKEQEAKQKTAQKPRYKQAIDEHLTHAYEDFLHDLADERFKALSEQQQGEIVALWSKHPTSFKMAVDAYRKQGIKSLSAYSNIRSFLIDTHWKLKDKNPRDQWVSDQGYQIDETKTAVRLTKQGKPVEVKLPA